MSMSTGTQYQAPIIGTDADDVIAVEKAIGFEWVPAAGNSNTQTYYDPYRYHSFPDAPPDSGPSVTIGPSKAVGHVTFDGVSSSEPFQEVPSQASFSATDGRWGFDVDASTETWFGFVASDGATPLASPWTYDPSTEVLDPQGTYVGAFYYPAPTWYLQANQVSMVLDTDPIEPRQTEADVGHWQLVPEIHNVNVFGGAGNDTILGGQGNEMLFGGEGNDLIRASSGEDLLYGGEGNDALHAGIGTQTVMGGEGNDTIWGGSGRQMLLGDDGADIIHGGSGQQTVMGGSGNDTLWGGSGSQFLEGGDGNDLLHAGSGNETLSGGAGRDIFQFSAANEHDVILDFKPGQDTIQLPTGLGGLALTQVKDLLSHVSADSHGNAVLSVGKDFSVVLQHNSVQSIDARPGDFFKLS
jgi:Ca2+-binding RTX toxin-like protein